ncbi:hypothetical protein MMC07_004538 [Pseudocyphellaria aurata]|nr:hypothetical protein [Pseudocyphellaria aurata]
MRDQLNSTSGVRSPYCPFVALFGDETQAKTWALRCEAQHQRVRDVVEISGMALSKLDVANKKIFIKVQKLTSGDRQSGWNSFYCNLCNQDNLCPSRASNLEDSPVCVPTVRRKVLVAVELYKMISEWDGWKDN